MIILIIFIDFAIILISEYSFYILVKECFSS